MVVPNKIPAILLTLVVGAIFAALLTHHTDTSFDKLPDVVLWAWERPENLSFIDPQKVAVALLAQSIELSGDRVSVYPRLQPLAIPDGTKLIAVARLTTSSRETPILSGQQMETTVENILSTDRVRGVCGIQIDFDAKKSDRTFYRVLLDTLRSRLPDSISLSITALASWCISDTWIADLPVDDAVPMLFRLGPDRLQVLQYLKAGNDFTIPLCRRSIGVSTDEPFPIMAHKRRIYAFSPKPWTKESFQSIMKKINP